MILIFNVISNLLHLRIRHPISGTLILICGGDTESAWCLSNDAYPFSNSLSETQSILPLDSPVWALAEIPGESAIQIEKPTTIQSDPPLLVRQHMEPPRKFIFLTAQVCKKITYNDDIESKNNF